MGESSLPWHSMINDPMWLSQPCSSPTVANERNHSIVSLRTFKKHSRWFANGVGWSHKGHYRCRKDIDYKKQAKHDGFFNGWKSGLGAKNIMNMQIDRRTTDWMA